MVFKLIRPEYIGNGVHMDSRGKINDIRVEIAKVIVGKEQEIELFVISLLFNGHLLLETWAKLFANSVFPVPGTLGISQLGSVSILPFVSKQKRGRSGSKFTSNKYFFLNDSKIPRVSSLLNEKKGLPQNLVRKILVRGIFCKKRLWKKLRCDFGGMVWKNWVRWKPR